MNFWNLFKKEKKQSQGEVPRPLIDWRARTLNVKNQFGDQVEKILFTKNFNREILSSIERVYWTELHSNVNKQSVNFGERSKLNFPEPFYTCETDNCGTGQPAAPNNILCDEEGREHLYKQPRSIEEMLEVLTAAYIDPFENYGFDGNENWNLNLIREWWSYRNDLIKNLLSDAFNSTNKDQNKVYIDYLNNEAKLDLMKYAFFLETGQYPDDNKNLPSID